MIHIKPYKTIHKDGYQNLSKDMKKADHSKKKSSKPLKSEKSLAPKTPNGTKKKPSPNNKHLSAEKHLSESRIMSFKKFEDACATGTTAGMGAVTSSQPGALPGTTGTTGSGDIGTPLLYSKQPGVIKKKKRFGDRTPTRGTSRQVSDMRFLGSDKIGDVFPVKKID